MRHLAWGALAATLGILFYAARDLPPVGDPRAPASIHVSPRFIEQSHEETGAANFVTAVVVDYRGYDTLGEATVILTAGLACLLILGARPGGAKETEEHESSLR
jgi:multicomponent Na+:H+ antiporter subunit B